MLPFKRITSPERSEGASTTSRRYRTRRSGSVGSPDRTIAFDKRTSLTQFRLIQMDSFVLSPMDSRRSILTDSSQIEQPRRKSWWRHLNETTQVTEVLTIVERKKVATNEIADVDKVIEHYINVQALSPENKDTNNLPESSDNESIKSIVIPPKKLFSYKENHAPNKLKQIISPRKSLHKSNIRDQNNTVVGYDKSIEVAPKTLFSKGFTRPKPVFPPALLTISPDKTMNKTTELLTIPKATRNLFCNKPAKKRENKYAQFILSDSDSEIELPETQPKFFGFKRKSVESQSHRPSRRDPSVGSSVSNDLDIDDWNLLPSSTMVEELESITTPKRTRYSKRLSEIKKHQETVTNPNTTSFRGNQTNKSVSCKNTLRTATITQEQISKVIEQENQIDENQTQKVKTVSKSIEIKEQENVNKQNMIPEEGEINTFENIIDNQNTKNILQNYSNDNLSSKSNKSDQETEIEQDMQNVDCSEEIEENTNEEDQKVESVENNKEQDLKSVDEDKDNEDLEMSQHSENSNNEDQQSIVNDVEDIDNGSLIMSRESEVQYETSERSDEKNKSQNDMEEVITEKAKEIDKKMNTDNVHDENNLNNEDLKNDHRINQLQDIIEEEIASRAEQSTTPQNLNHEQIHKELSLKSINNGEVLNSTSTTVYMDKRDANLISPEAVLHEKNKSELYRTKGRNTSVRKTTSIIHNLPSLEPIRHSTEIDDTTQSSVERSGWDSHRTTRKTLRQTFGKDFTPRKSLRTLVMEKSAKRQTGINIEAVLNSCNDNNLDIRQPNSTELRKPSLDVLTENKIIDHLDPQIVEGAEANTNGDKEQVVKSKENQEEHSVKKRVENMDNEDLDICRDSGNTNCGNQIESMENHDEHNIENNDNEMDNEDLEMTQYSENRNDKDQQVEGMENREEHRLECSDEIMENEGLEMSQNSENTNDEDQQVESMENYGEHNLESDDEDLDNEGLEMSQNSENTNDEDHQVESMENHEEHNFESDDEDMDNEGLEMSQNSENTNDEDQQVGSMENHGEHNFESDDEDMDNQGLEMSQNLENSNDEDQQIGSMEYHGEHNLESDNEDMDNEGLEISQNSENTNDEDQQVESIENHGEHSLESDDEDMDNVGLEISRESEAHETSESNGKNGKGNNCIEDIITEDEYTQDIEESTNNNSLEEAARQKKLEMHLQKIRKQNMEERQKIEQACKNSLRPPLRDRFNLFTVPSKPYTQRRTANTIQSKPKKTIKPSIIPMDDLPPEFLDDLQYKPPKRFQPRNASWITRHLYKFLETKLEPKYDYKARLRAEKLVQDIYDFTKIVRRNKLAPKESVDALKHEMARLNIVQTHYEFYCFFHKYMPREIRVKVNPDIVNEIPLPKQGMFSDIIPENAEQ